jgi:ribosome-binding protein aMBF1 (putative translation factor)
MGFICRRCDRTTKQELYRVTTEDAGVVLLNMVVCSSCARLAKRLGLPAVKIENAKRITKTKDQTPPNRRQTARPRPSIL